MLRRLFPSPSHLREWIPEQSVLPRFRVEDGVVLVEGVRNFHWHAAEHFDPSWETRTYQMDQLRAVWFAVTPFTSRWRGAAHTLLSFQFGDRDFLAVSVEARREVGESYGLLKGLFRRFELIYVAADERDLLGVRALHRPDQVYLYPTRVTPEALRTLFLQVAASANQLREAPEFYHTITNNCTTRIVRHVNAVAPRRVSRFRPSIVMPGYSDALAFRLGLLDTDLSLAQTRARWLVNDRARRWIGDSEFSLRIRDPE